MPLPAARNALALVAATVLAAGIAGCGGGSSGPAASTPAAAPSASAGGASSGPATTAGMVTVTKNTSRIGAADEPSLAAAIALAVYPGAGQRPPAVAIADAGDWRAALAGAVLMAPPLRAPILLTDGGEVPAATAAAVRALAPTGSPATSGTQAIRLGTGGDPGGGLRTEAIAGDDPYTLAANIDAFRIRVAGRASDAVVVAPAQAPAFAMPAAAWAAKSGDPVLFADGTSLPAPTRNAIRAHGRPRIYVLGPPAAISSVVATQLSRLGTVTRISAPTPQASAVAFARFRDGTFGWGVVDPGHGLVFANPTRPIDAGPAAALSATGTYGPLLLTADDGTLPAAVRGALLDIKPGYSSDPVRGVYNHGWIVGDPGAVTAETQATIDGLLEIAPVTPTGSSP